MIVDTSAVVAIIQEEPGFEVLLEKLADAESRSMSAASYFEASMVLIDRRGDAAEKELDQMLADAAIAIIAVTVTQVKIARAGFRRYGKGRDAAGLNLGIASPMHWRSRLARRCCSREMILGRRM